MKDVKFIRLSKENINIISNVVRIDDEELSKQDIEKFIIDDDNYCFIGIIEDKIIAFLYGYGMLRPDGKSMFYIHAVDVLPDYQNRGIGTKLMDYVLNYIKEEKCFYKYFVLTESDNIKACKLYQKYAKRDEQVLFSSKI